MHRRCNRTFPNGACQLTRDPLVSNNIGLIGWILLNGNLVLLDTKGTRDWSREGTYDIFSDYCCHDFARKGAVALPR